jgi:aminoglycoside phosphotransferase (APT) family kinase protein
VSAPFGQDFLVANGLAAPGESPRWTALTGGVSSDIWRVESSRADCCVKRARPRLKVDACWEAPVSRNAYEWAWLQFAARHEPDSVPRPLAIDPHAGLFAMSFLPPEAHPVWKQQLMQGSAQAGTAAAVGALIGRLHSASAGDETLASGFDNLPNFEALRLDPYLIATGSVHTDLAPRLENLARQTASARIALVHGDVSPKNILVGPRGPILLDAECAWFGDPAFDIAFCLNHLLLKCLVRPEGAGFLRAEFGDFCRAYFDAIDFEPTDQLEARAAALLPALMLARIDGKSPVEYLADEHRRAQVRAFARPRIATPPRTLTEVADDWHASLRAGPTARAR